MAWEVSTIMRCSFSILSVNGIFQCKKQAVEMSESPLQQHGWTLYIPCVCGKYVHKRVTHHHYVPDPRRQLCLDGFVSLVSRLWWLRNLFNRECNSYASANTKQHNCTTGGHQWPKCPVQKFWCCAVLCPEKEPAAASKWVLAICGWLGHHTKYH